MIQVFDLDRAAFPDDRRQVAYAGLHLIGAAGRWWEGVTTQLPENAMRSDWQLFVQSLNRRFGDPYAQQTAIGKIDRLRMREHHQVTRYLLDFEELAPDTRFNDEALNAAFYKGLAYRIKRDMTNIGRPADLQSLQDLALRLDYNQWELSMERRPSAYPPPIPIPTTNRSPADPRPNQTPNPQSSTSRPTVPVAERQRRRQDNLCLNCGQSGHRAAQCPNPVKTGRLAFTLSDEADAAEPDPASDEVDPDDDEDDLDLDPSADPAEATQGND